MAGSSSVLASTTRWPRKAWKACVLTVSASLSGKATARSFPIALHVWSSKMQKALRLHKPPRIKQQPKLLPLLPKKLLPRPLKLKPLQKLLKQKKLLKLKPLQKLLNQPLRPKLLNRPPSPQLRQKLLKSKKTQQRSEEHTSELQSQFHLVCRLLLEKN